MEKILKNLHCGKVLTNVNLKKYTTYRIPTIAKYMVFPSCIEELERILTYIKEKKLSYKIIGGGSNLIFQKEIYDGILICLSSFDFLFFPFSFFLFLLV